MHWRHMRRRDVLALLGGAAGTTLVSPAARAQQPMPVIGFLHPSSPEPYRLRAFRQSLKDVGFVEGENVTIEYRWADNQLDRLPALAAELAQRRVAVIAAAAPPAVFAAKAATTTIPIVFLVSEDPVKLGLVTSLARPGGNLTGINFSRRSWRRSGWNSCVNWCPGPLILPCSSIRSMRRSLSQR